MLGRQVFSQHRRVIVSDGPIHWALGHCLAPSLDSCIGFGSEAGNTGETGNPIRRFECDVFSLLGVSVSTCLTDRGQAGHDDRSSCKTVRHGQDTGTDVDARRARSSPSAGTRSVNEKGHRLDVGGRRPRSSRHGPASTAPGSCRDTHIRASPQSCRPRSSWETQRPVWASPAGDSDSTALKEEWWRGLSPPPGTFRLNGSGL